MKRILLAAMLLLQMFAALNAHSQCTNAQLNWDRLDYYYNSGTNIQPYGYSGNNYVTNNMERTQKFAIGPNQVTFATSAAGMVRGENGDHDGELSGFTGDDAQFTPSANGQTITMTFRDAVTNTSFAFYDVDASQRITVDAYNTANVKQSVTITLQGTTNLSRTNGTNAQFWSNATAVASPSNAASATISIPTSINRIVITFTTIGTDPTCYLSDINACVTGSFPNNYQQTGSNRPLQGPVTNQPDYFLITPDNNSAYMVDPVTGIAKHLFTDASNTYMNCFAYDPENHILYYVSEGWPAVATNKQVKKYDFTTNTISVVIPDISTAFNIPTFDQSLEGAGGAFYNGQLYIGVEGGKFDPFGTTNDRTRESMIFRIDFDASLNPTDISQVFAVPSYANASNDMLQDWGDFIIKDGVLINYNSRTSPSTVVKYEHFNMMTGASVLYNSSSITSSQAGISWNGNLYTFYSNGIRQYNGAGGFIGSLIPITLPGGTWPGGAGDGGENYRPPMDFGDAPSSYDPNALAPAAHETDPLLYLGSGFDREWSTRGQTALANSDNLDDGLPYVGTFYPSAGLYLTQTTVFNNTGSPATLCAWLDYNGDGQFQNGEGISQSIPSSASPQSVYLFWPSIVSSLPVGSHTYLRIRIAYGTSGMTTAHATGYFGSGEVEDYRVNVNSYVLSTQSNSFEASLTQAKTVKLNWKNQDETNVSYYLVERSSSANGSNWEVVDYATARRSNGLASYEGIDGKLPAGVSYYRLKMVSDNGSIKISEVRRIENKISSFSMSIAPNPASSRATLFITSDNTDAEANIELLNAAGAVVFKQRTKLKKGTNSVEIQPVSTLPSGRYLVRVLNGNELLTKSLIIKK